MASIITRCGALFRVHNANGRIVPMNFFAAATTEHLFRKKTDDIEIVGYIEIDCYYACYCCCCFNKATHLFAKKLLRACVARPAAAGIAFLFESRSMHGNAWAWVWKNGWKNTMSRLG